MKNPIGGGGSNPKPKKSVMKRSIVSVNKTVETTIDKKSFKTFLSLIPLIALFLVCVSTNYYYFFNNSYSVYYDLISSCTGFSLFSLPSFFYIVYKYKFCDYSKIALFGLLFCVLTNISWFFLDLWFDINTSIYSNVFESLIITLFLIIAIYHLIISKKNRY